MKTLIILDISDYLYRNEIAKKILFKDRKSYQIVSQPVTVERVETLLKMKYKTIICNKADMVNPDLIFTLFNSVQELTK